MGGTKELGTARFNSYLIFLNQNRVVLSDNPVSIESMKVIEYDMIARIDYCGVIRNSHLIFEQ